MNYGYEKIEYVSPEMEKWGIWLRESPPTNFGEYVVVGLEPATIEGSHQVLVIDENGDPLNGVYVIFGFPGGGPDIPLQPRRSHWQSAPRVLKGNYVSPVMGQAEHTFGEGGEDVWIWDLTPEKELRYSSTIVHNCRWIQQRFIHTGVRITFQRRDSSILPDASKWDQLEARVTRLERALDDLTPGSLADTIDSSSN